MKKAEQQQCVTQLLDRDILTQTPYFKPDEFKDSPNRRARAINQAFGDGAGWASRLFMDLEDPHLYSLRAVHIGMSSRYEHYLNIFRYLPVQQVIAKLKKIISSPFYYKFEVGKGWDDNLPRLHFHLIANGDAGLLDISRTGELIKIPTLEDFERVIGYLSKPKLAYTPELEQALKTERERLSGKTRFPRTAGCIWG